MTEQHKLRQLFAGLDTYKALYEGYLARGINQKIDQNDKENNLDSEGKLHHYFSVGADALRIITGALMSNLRPVPQRILDFPCGSGRVTRHLQAFFPDQHIVACDLYDYHVGFCVNELGVDGIISKENFDDIDFGEKFDLIFCGSLLTHLPADLIDSALKLLSRSLSERGLAVITLHGRHSEYRQEHIGPYISDDLFGVIESTLSKTGFGYVDYDHPMRSIFSGQARYGVSISRPRWSAGLMEKDLTTRLLGYEERAWDDHQDVMVIGKPAINE